MKTGHSGPWSGARLCAWLGTCLLLLVLAGCAARGPGFAEVSSALPSLGQDKGRVFFYRSTSMLGAAIQPDVYVDNRPLGRSQPGGFFYVDLDPGHHTASATTEARATIELDVEPGRTQYVSMSIGIGFVAGRLLFSLVPESVGRGEISSLNYAGLSPVGSAAGRNPPPAPGGSATPPASSGSGSGAAAAARTAQPSGRVTMDDLSGLLPSRKP